MSLLQRPGIGERLGIIRGVFVLRLSCSGRVVFVCLADLPAALNAACVGFFVRIGRIRFVEVSGVVVEAQPIACLVRYLCTIVFSQPFCIRAHGLLGVYSFLEEPIHRLSVLAYWTVCLHFQLRARAYR